MGLLSPSFVLSAISILFRPYMFFTSQFHEVHHGHIIRPALYAVDIFCLLAGLLSFDYPVWMSFNELKLVFRYLKYTRSSLRSYSSIFSPWYRYSDINWQFLCDIWSLTERSSPLKQEKKAGNPHIFLIWSSPRFHFKVWQPQIIVPPLYGVWVSLLIFMYVRPSKSVCMLSYPMMSYRDHHAPFYPHK